MEKSVRASCIMLQKPIARQFGEREAPEATAEKDWNFR